MYVGVFVCVTPLTICSMYVHLSILCLLVLLCSPRVRTRTTQGLCTTQDGQRLLFPLLSGSLTLPRVVRSRSLSMWCPAVAQGDPEGPQKDRLRRTQIQTLILARCVCVCARVWVCDNVRGCISFSDPANEYSDARSHNNRLRKRRHHSKER